MGEILTELSGGILSIVETVPEYAVAIKEFGENLIFTGEGDDRKVSAVFAWLVIGGVVTLGISVFKAITRRIAGSK